MIKKVAGGLAALGLIGGAGSVVYDNQGDATVNITDSSGRVQSVHFDGVGPTYSCPDGTQDKLQPYDINLGRIKLTLQQVRQDARSLERRYPTRRAASRAPDAAVARYTSLRGREERLIKAFNAEVEERNAIIASDCETE